MSRALHANDRQARTSPPVPRGVHLVYEWFAGWRWEYHRAGALVSESLESFDSREQCLVDANARCAPSAESDTASLQQQPTDLAA